MTETKIDPKQHDEAIAALYFDLDKAQQRIRVSVATIMQTAGFRLRYFGRKQDWARETTTSGDHWEIERVTFRDGLRVLLKREDRAASLALATHEQELAVAEAISAAIEEAEAAYTGWNRFFLVTSSQGHIHSNMQCSTCRPTTKFGWLPELSGDTEDAAVQAHGPALCTVCFPSAPVDNTGFKISASKAQEEAWSPDRQEKIAQREEREKFKAEVKAKKAASKLKYDESLAHKVNFLVDKFGTDESAEYKWTWDNKGYNNAHFVHSDMFRKRKVTA